MQQIGTATEQGILAPRQLAAQVRRLIETPADWVTRVRLDPEGRWYEQIPLTDLCELWLISWLPGQSTGFHDHGGASGAFGVVWGQLDEHLVPRRAAWQAAGLPVARPAERTVVIAPGASPAYGATAEFSATCG